MERGRLPAKVGVAGQQRGSWKVRKKENQRGFLRDEGGHTTKVANDGGEGDDKRGDEQVALPSRSTITTPHKKGKKRITRMGGKTSISKNCPYVAAKEFLPYFQVRGAKKKNWLSMDPDGS